MEKYYLQEKVHPWDDKHWVVHDESPFETLEAARAALASRPFPSQWRIAEAYTVTRYKPVKL